MRKNRTEEHEACIEHLREARTESEKLAQELHALKMKDEN